MCLAAPAMVVSVSDQNGILMGEVDFGGVRKTICLAYLSDIQVGEYVLVHAGFALERVDPEEVSRFYQLWREVLEASPSPHTSSSADQLTP